MVEIPEQLIAAMRRARKVAVLTGAGVSRESGIPTFRGEDGLWENHNPTDLATPEAFARDPKLVWRWYEWRRELCRGAQPNPAHLAITAFEQHYPEFLLITQNVDGLHRRAGTRRMVEIHGNIFRARCTACDAAFPLIEGPLQSLPPDAARCKSMARPNVVWFGESYDPALLEQAMTFVRECELLLVIGTSGMVSMPVFLAERAVASGALCVDVNPETSGMSRLAEYCLQGAAGTVLPMLVEAIGVSVPDAGAATAAPCSLEDQRPPECIRPRV